MAGTGPHEEATPAGGRGRPRPRRGRGQDGATAVEFAFVLPVVLTLIGIIGSAGLYGMYSSLLERSAEFAAREVAIHGPEQAEGYAGEGLILLTPDAVVVEPPDPAAGEVFTVTVTTRLPTPFAPLLRQVSVDAAGTGASVEVSRHASGVRE